MKNNPVIKAAIEELNAGFGGISFREIGDSLVNSDPYMVLADFEAYDKARKQAESLYANPAVWHRMGLVNTANAGRFAADRAIREYAQNIWSAEPLPEPVEKPNKKVLFGRK